MNLSSVKKINHIPLAIGSFFVFILGALFLFLTLFKPGIPEGFEKVEARITNIEEQQDPFGDWNYQVYIDFTCTNGDSHTNELYPKYDSSININDIVTIYVDPNNTSNFMADQSDAFIFPLLSGIFMVIGGCVFVYNVKELVKIKKRKEELE